MSQAGKLWDHFLQRRSAVGLALFRVVYSLALLGEVSELIWFRHLIFDPVPYEIPASWPVDLMLFVWIPVTVCLMFGLWTRLMTILNYGFTLMTFGVFLLWEYHIDYVYCGINLLLIFVPVEEVLSVDRIRRDRMSTSSKEWACSVPRIHYDALIFVGIALVYFDSVFHKLSTRMWTEGLGLWQALALPHTSIVNVGWLLDQEWLMYFLGYLALVFECAFLPLMWIDRFRPLLLVIGAGMHLGILCAFPIPWFAIGMLSLYLLLVPDQWWKGIASKTEGFVRSNPTDVAEIQTESSAWASRQIRGRSQAAIVGAIALTCFVLQSLQTCRSPLAHTISSKLGCSGFMTNMAQVAARLHPLSRRWFGATPHTVYLDLHFDDNDTIYTLVYVDQGKRTWLPMFTQSGMASLGWSGREWAFWAFRACGPGRDQQRLETGIRIVVPWWMHKYQPGKNTARFDIMSITYDEYDRLTIGYFQKQLAKEWKPVGTVTWSPGEWQVEMSMDNDERGS